MHRDSVNHVQGSKIGPGGDLVGWSPIVDVDDQKNSEKSLKWLQKLGNISLGLTKCSGFII